VKTPEKRKPWFMFYGRDWRSSPKLRLCSFAARGLWADILTLMHESIHPGFLLIEGVVPSVKQLAGLLGGTEKEIRTLLAELAATNVYSVTGESMADDVKELIPDGMPDGVMISRRMARDDAKARRDKANGGRGGNPRLNPQ
jgi:hypothetical protein